jgi:hypothetical protein
VLITAPGSMPGGLYGPWLGWTYAPIVAILAIFCRYTPSGSLPARQRGLLLHIRGEVRKGRAEPRGVVL